MFDDDGDAAGYSGMSEEAALGALADVAAFAGLGDTALDRIEKRCRWLELQPDMQIFSRGDAADAVFAVVSGGPVRIGTIGRSSKGLMVEMLRPGDIFGELGVLDGGVRSADAHAEGRVRLLRIGASVFLDALNTYPTLGSNLCRLMTARLRRTFTLFEDATFESLEVRLARQLLYLSRRDVRRTEQGLRLSGRFRQADLADLLGTTTRSIITVLNAWRESGAICYDAARAQLTITDEAQLRALAFATD